jgi:S1-C subfamily serine protease
MWTFGRATLLAAIFMLLSHVSAAIAQPTISTTQTGMTLKSVKVNGREFSTPAAALDAIRLSYNESLGALMVEPDPVSGRARVIVPDRDRLRPMVQQTFMRTPTIMSTEVLEFYVNNSRLGIRANADALVKSNAFEKVTVVEQNDTLNPDVGDADFVIWYQVRNTAPDNTGLWQGHWLLRRAGDEDATSVALDPGVAVGTPRFASFVKSVREAALRQGGATVRAAGSGIAKTTSNQGHRVVSSGSGIVIDTAGYVLTNNHVVGSCRDLRVSDAPNGNSPATLVVRDTANDLAVLKTTRQWTQAATFRDSREIRQGDEIVVTGFPLNRLRASGMSLTTGSLTALAGPRDDSRLLQVTAPIQPGNSGGPLLDSGGHVIGVITSTLNGAVLAIATGAVPQNVNFAIKTIVVRNFLETNSIPYASATDRATLTPADVGDLARKFTVRIECEQPTTP